MRRINKCIGMYSSMQSLIQESDPVMRNKRVLLFRHSLCAVLMLAALPLSAQPDQAGLKVTTENGQTTFHIGERIPLNLTFSSQKDTEYLITPLVSGRGDEFDCNRFQVVSPATGWSDPFEMYFKQDLPREGHGWPLQPLMKSKPVQASVDLNEWIRFDQPGDYTIKITSFCVSRVDRAEFEPLAGTVKLEMVRATPEWQAEKFKAIKAHLDSLDDQFAGARAALKYLATPAAIDEMTLRLRSEKYNFADQCSIGLEGLPPAMREIAIASMNKRIKEPDYPITTWFFSTLSYLHVSPGSEKESIRKQREAIAPVIWSAIFSAVTKKDPAARAETVQTLLAYGRNISTPEVKQQMASLLKLSFLDLDGPSQEDDLRAEWDRLKSPEFLPTLQKIARPPVQSGNDRMQLRGLALKRWYELDPEGAHREIVAQIGSASPSLDARSIAFLPEEQFPQFEPLWAQALLDTNDQWRVQILGSLLVRFGTGALTSQMIAKLDETSVYPCQVHIEALAYLARFSPDLARERLRREVAIDEGKCGTGLLRLISEITTAPALNDLAVENLNSPDPETVIDAVRYLTPNSRKEDEAPLWRRYVEWTGAYQGNAGLLDKLGPGDWDKNFASSEIGAELGNALIRGQGWFADPAYIARVLERCVGERMCKQLKDDAHWAVSPYQLDIPDSSNPMLSMAYEAVGVAQYGTRSLKLFEEKISQFPPGSRFALERWYHPQNNDERTLEAKVRAILVKHGMTLETSQD